VTFTLGQLFNFTLDLKQYVVAKLAPRKKKSPWQDLIQQLMVKTMIITSMAIDPHMAMI
jgi:hypothetical protein